MISSGAKNSVRLTLALDQIQVVRKYTLERLDGLSPQEWFAMPGGVTHIAWQVGHLAMAQYRLCLDRIRGERDDDRKLISLAMLTLFGKGSTPEPDSTKYPSIADIRAALDRVHDATLAECATLAEPDLDAPTLRPHPHFTTKLGALFWCSRHEMAHAGQIGLIRRLLGKSPLW